MTKNYINHAAYYKVKKQTAQAKKCLHRNYHSQNLLKVSTYKKYKFENASSFEYYATDGHS